MRKLILPLLIFFSLNQTLTAQLDEDQLGAWYMYFFDAKFGESQFGVQGDYQFRFWDFGSDLEQILLRSGLTFSPKDAGVKFTLGYGHITSGVPGDSDDKSTESRVYQEALFGQKLGSRFLLTHRLRYEQRWVENQDFRTRFRYNLFVNVPLNNTSLAKKTVYLAFYNEIFLNGQKDIGSDTKVQHFDRNRTYLGVGYVPLDKMRFQIGWMKQSTVNWGKGQAQFSVHQKF